MCGIGGILALKEFPAGDLLKMTSMISHRGPDDEGYLLVGQQVVVAGGDDTPEIVWRSHQPNTPSCPIRNLGQDDFFLGMGHRRLSIIDLTAGGHQPFCDPKQKVSIIFNGEIYNYRAVREQLTELGYSFRTESDTEVLLFSFMQWGTECLNRLEGMWSFVIYDSVKNRLFFARDRFGIKPLYYWISPRGDLYWGSEIKQFSASPQWSARLNHAMALDYLLYAMTDHTSETMFDDVKQLRSGTYLEVDIGEFRSNPTYTLDPKCWYSLPEKNFDGTFEDACEAFRERFFYAVESHLQADVPVGSALSGGLDSSSIVCAIHQLRGSNAPRQQTFSSCSLDPEFDERKWMELVVAETGVDSHFVYPDGKDIFNLTDKLIWYMDEPYQSQSAFLGYHVFQKAKENNVKVLLNGQGADEYFNCYGGLLSFLPLELVKKLRIGDTWSLLRKMNASQRQSFYRQLLEILMPFSFWSIAKRIKKLDPKTNEVRNVLQRKKFSCGFRHPYLIDDFRKTSGRTVSRHQLCIEPLPKYLRWEDRNSMAHSVEARVPFLCHHLVEFTQSLPIQYLTSVEQPKRIMAESLRGCLTEAIRNRQDKQGFITPEQRWFIKDHRDEFLSLLETNIPYAQGLIDRKSAIDYLRNMQLGKIEFDYSYWRIILFCIWMKVFSVKV